MDGDEPFAGKYAVERVIGQGGMGTVFEARHLRLGHRVALKVLGSSLREYPELVQRFEREARACGSLSSDHAVRVFDIDLLEDGTPFIVLELLTGRDLSQIIERDGPQPVSRAVRWLTEACDAIAEAHRLGIIHRDIKPSNLFLAEVDGKQVVKVLDFGIAKRVKSTDAAITQALIPLGTPQYMSPEQVRCAKDVDARSDVWSLGISLYELVCGSTPFPDPSASAVIAAIAADEVPDPRILRPDLGEAFVAVIMRALAKSAADRYQSVEELVTALAPFASDEDDFATVSAVRRMLASAPDEDVTDRPTLDVIEVPATFMTSEADPFGARAPFESRSDRTVPPAVGVVEVPVRRRFRSAIALSSAAALAVAMLAVGARLLAPAGSGVAELASASPSLATELISPVVVAPAPVPAESAAEEAELVVAAPTPLAVPATPASSTIPTKALVARPLVSGLAILPPPPPGRALAAARPSADKAMTASRGVHGGLSSPGF